MERDDLREVWASLETQLRRVEGLNDMLVTQSLAQRAQTPLVRERRMLWLEIAANAIAVMALGSFAADRAHDPAVLISAGTLAVALLIVNATLLRIAISLRAIDFDEPVLAIQTALEREKMRRARLTAAILLAGPLLWTPLLIVMLALGGVDAMRALGVAYLAVNLAFGLAVAIGGWLAARHFAPRLRGAGWVARAADALSGGSYREAADFLDTIVRFKEVA